MANEGDLIWNSTTKQPEYYNGTAWGPNFGTWFSVPTVGNATSTAPVANQNYYAQVVVPVAASITGIAFYLITVGTGVNMRSSLYDSSGTRVANKTANVAGTAVTFMKIPFDSAYQAAPGIYFANIVFSAAQGTYFAATATSPSSVAAGPGSNATLTSITVPTNAGATVPPMTTY